MHRPGGLVSGRCDGGVHGPGSAFVHHPDDPQPVRISGSASCPPGSRGAPLGIRRRARRFSRVRYFPGGGGVASDSAPGRRGQAGKSGGAACGHRRPGCKRSARRLHRLLAEFAGLEPRNPSARLSIGGGGHSGHRAREPAGRLVRLFPCQAHAGRKRQRLARRAWFG